MTRPCRPVPVSRVARALVRPWPTRRSRGAFSVFVATAGVSLMILFGLVVDFNGQVNARQDAQLSAAQAGRAAGQAVDAASLLGGSVRVDKNAARRAAQKYLAGRGLHGAVSFTGNRIVVRVDGVYPTKVLSMVGIEKLPVHGTSVVELIPTDR